MVRVVVGTLIEVAAGRKRPEWVREVLDARERAAAGPTAPAHGLTLHSVTYPEGVWQ
jgi:tRNA pseudouridine38-40 synthase